MKPKYAFLKSLMLVITGAFGVLSCSTTVDTTIETEALTTQIIRGSQISLVIVDAGELGSQSEMTVVKNPSNGIVRQNGAPGTVAYQHGGADRVADSFSLVWRDVSGVEYSKVVNVEFRDRLARVVILAPRNGAAFRSGDIEVRYQTQGQDFDHLHISLDNQGHNTIRDLTGAFTLENVPPGEHLVGASLVDKNHNAIGGADANASIRITVLP